MAKFPGKLRRRSRLLTQIEEPIEQSVGGLITRLLKGYSQAGNGHPWGNDRRPRHEGPQAPSFVDAPTVIDACGLCIGILNRGVMRPHNALFDHALVFESTNSIYDHQSPPLSAPQFPRKFSRNFLKFESFAPCDCGA